MSHASTCWRLMLPYAPVSDTDRDTLPMPTKKPRAQRLETATQRRKLPIAKRPVYAKIAPNIFLGYRRNEGPGTWNVRVTGPGIDWVKRIGLADDFEPSDGRAVLTYWQALDQARKLARRQPGDQARGEWPEHVMREVIGRALR